MEARTGQSSVTGWTIQPMCWMAATSFRSWFARDRRNIRIWLEDSSNDLENRAGSWPLQNIQLANSLKMKECDFYLSFGNHQHSTEHGNAELPKAMIWLWLGHDAAKTSQNFMMDAEEKAKPYFRVEIVNR